MNIGQVFDSGKGRYVGINLDLLSGPDFSRIKGKLKNVRDHVLYDGLRFAKTTAWAPNDFDLFQVAFGQNTFVANNTALTYAKDESDTNLQGNGGQLPSGDFFTVQSIMCKLACAENQDTTELSNTQIINPTPVALAANTAAGGANFVLAFTENTTLKFIVDDARTYENGTVDYFPQGFGYSGWNGGSEGGLAQNGGVLPRMLARPRHLRELQRFVLRIRNTKTITTTVSCRFKLGLWGALYVPVG
jgi:hypothetical protein